MKARGKAKPELNIVIDKSVDPIELRVSTPDSTLLIKTVNINNDDLTFTVFDLAKIFNGLGFTVNYEEL